MNFCFRAKMHDPKSPDKLLHSITFAATSASSLRIHKQEFQSNTKICTATGAQGRVFLGDLLIQADL